MRRLRCLAFLLPLAACVHTVNPRVTPEKLAVVTPPIERRALLLRARVVRLTLDRVSAEVHLQVGDVQLGVRARW